jgi:transposase-like protein
MVQRGGKVVAVTVENVQRATLMPHIMAKVLPASTVYTDELPVYNILNQAGYQHERIQHSEKVYVSGDVHINTIEGFWSLVKARYWWRVSFRFQKAFTGLPKRVRVALQPTSRTRLTL